MASVAMNPVHVPVGMQNTDSGWMDHVRSLVLGACSKGCFKIHTRNGGMKLVFVRMMGNGVYGACEDSTAHQSPCIGDIRDVVSHVQGDLVLRTAREKNPLNLGDRGSLIRATYSALASLVLGKGSKNLGRGIKATRFGDNVPQTPVADQCNTLETRELANKLGHELGEIVGLLALGLTQRQIATQLGVCETVVSKRIAKIRKYA